MDVKHNESKQEQIQSSEAVSKECHLFNPTHKASDVTVAVTSVITDS